MNRVKLDIAGSSEFDKRKKISGGRNTSSTGRNGVRVLITKLSSEFDLTV